MALKRMDGIKLAYTIPWPESNQAMIPKVNQGGPSMHSLVFVLSIVGFGLELAAFLLTVAVL